MDNILNNINNIKNKIEKLREQIEFYAKKYHEDDVSLISDYDYDMLVK